MCVIAGYIGDKQAAPVLLEMLAREEGLAGAFYTGIATVHEGKLHDAKVVGDVAALRRQTEAESLPGAIGIAHGRPASGGGREWAHPFVDRDEKLAYIANGSHGHFQGITDLSLAARPLFEAGYIFRSAQNESIEAYPTRLPNGQSVHGSDVMCQVVAENRARHANAPHPLFAGLMQAFQEWPAEIVALCLHADCPDEIVAARHNMPMVIGRDAAGAVYIASAGLAFPQAVNWRTRMPPRSGAVLARNGSIRIEPFMKQAIPVAELPSPTAVEQRLVGLLRERGACKADQLMEATRPLWPTAQLNQKEVVVYEALEAWLAEGRVTFEQRPTPGMFGQGRVPQTWVQWNFGGGRRQNADVHAAQTPRDAQGKAGKPYAAPRIRNAAPADVDAIVEITREAFGPMSIARISEQYFGQQLGGKPWHAYKCQSVADMLQAHPDRFIVAEVDDRPVGYASYWFDPQLGIATIGNNAVHPTYQKRGIASAMQREIIQRFKAAGYERWQVTTLGHDYPAQRVYEKLGFEEVARSVHYLRKPEQAAGDASPRTASIASASQSAPRVLLVLLGHVHSAVVGAHGDYEQLYARALRTGVSTLEYDTLPLVDDPHAPLPDVSEYDGVVISGGAANVTEQGDWLAPAVRVVRAALQHQTPMLGICLGHQVLAHATGAEVRPIDLGWMFGRAEVTLGDAAANDELFAGFSRQFQANVTHRQAVLRTSEAITVLGSAPHDPHHVIRVGRCAWGVQLHPEFTEAFMRDVLAPRRDLLDQAAGPGAAARYEATLGDTPDAASILLRFARLCDGRRNAQVTTDQTVGIV